VHCDSPTGSSPNASSATRPLGMQVYCRSPAPMGQIRLLLMRYLVYLQQDLPNRLRRYNVLKAFSLSHLGGEKVRYPRMLMHYYPAMLSEKQVSCVSKLDVFDFNSNYNPFAEPVKYRANLVLHLKKTFGASNFHLQLPNRYHISLNLPAMGD
jgi:hypothetical protein